MKKVQTSLLARQVYDILLEEIVRRELKPNQKLDVNQLADQLSVSRTPVMDALARLETDGLVLRRNRVGTFVTPLDKSVFIASFQARDMVEQYVTPLSIANLQSDDIINLRNLLASFTGLLIGVNDDTFDYTSYTRYDYDFHLTLIKLCGNRQIIEFYHSLNSHMQIARAYSRRALHRAQEGSEEHHQILQAFADKDVNRAQLLQHTHLERSREGVLKIIEEHGFL